MPKLVIFAPCLKVIISERDDSLSLIALMDAISVSVAEGAEVPADAKVPNPWDILTFWRNSPEDAGKEFEQRTQLLLPNGETSVEAIISFSGASRSQRNVINVTGVPVGQAGECFLQLWLREVGMDDWGDPVAEYSLVVVHQFVPGDRQQNEE